MQNLPQEYIAPYLEALECELKYQREQGGHPYRVHNGELLSMFHQEYVYLFEFDSEVLIPEGIPVSLSYENEKIYGTVISFEGNQLLLSLQREIGRTVKTAFINISPWKLLEALIEKLRTFSARDQIARSFFEYKNSADLRKTFVKGQVAAKQYAASKNVTVIWGPPGTGKTHTIAEISADYVNSGKNVLLVSQSNVSVDGMILKIAEILQERGNRDLIEAGKVLRYGFARTEQLARSNFLTSFNYALYKNPSLQEKLDELQKQKSHLFLSKRNHSSEYVMIEKQIQYIHNELEKQEKEFISDAQIVSTTISKVQIDPIFAERKYDAVIFDEVSMAYIPQIIYAAMKAEKHFVIVGDFKQLAPIVSCPDSACKDVLTRDIFSFLGINLAGKPQPHDWLVMLDVQRRMHPSISNFANKRFYENLLQDHSSVQTNRNDIIQRFPMQGQPINLIDLRSLYAVAAKTQEHSRFNILSAVISFSTALACEKNGEQSIGVITPYDAHARLIRAMLKDHKERVDSSIVCSTVHQFQGSERNVIVIDTVENHPMKKLGWLTSRNDYESLDRLVNVAVTRAKGKLFAVANKEFWEMRNAEAKNPFYDLLSYCAGYGKTISIRNNNMELYLSALKVNENIVLYPGNLDAAITSLLEQLKSAKESILVILPDSNFDIQCGELIFSELSAARQRGISTRLLAKELDELPPKWQQISESFSDAVCPLICIDDHIIWYGLPQPYGYFREKEDRNHNRIFNTSMHVAVAIKGKRTIKVIKEFLRLKNMEAVLQPQTETAGTVNLAKYISENVKCPTCHAPMLLKQSFKGKPYWQCSSCKATGLLTPDTINDYMARYNILCPEHGCRMNAGVGKFGIYIRCICGHFINPNQL